MKKTIFSLAFILIGSFAFANDIKFEDFPKNDFQATSIVQNETISSLEIYGYKVQYVDVIDEETGACSSWITVTSSCGSVYYLCADNYSNMNQLIKQVQYFDSVKC
ncbi:hypothetical protein J2X31_003098 [Flavobacterium arsenatis]|uniref:Beta/gamma crystallin 'Greek key' domain-containing protein n=1 Tax=Flavobacterium arsenatis TaxID=1484332 RepID=A0ABU1TT93_9FLAO|nr:hypothetical protein [Flavobacterium arsenatis]MDR6969072.1 hypothetical protein [Flavobacterium arsenatis]